MGTGVQEAYRPGIKLRGISHVSHNAPLNNSEPVFHIDGPVEQGLGDGPRNSFRDNGIHKVGSCSTGSTVDEHRGPGDVARRCWQVKKIAVQGHHVVITEVLSTPVIVASDVENPSTVVVA